MAWTAGARGGAQAIAWLSTLYVARLLSPADYGIATAASVYLGLLGMISEFGLGTAIVSQQRLRPQEINQLGGFAALSGLIVWVLTVLFAPLIASSLGVPELKSVLPVLGLATALAAINSLPLGILQKGLRFRAVAKADFLRVVFGAAITLGLALAGFGYWSLIWGQVSAVALFSVVLYVHTRYAIEFPRFRSIRASLTISSDVVASRLAWYAYSNSDNLLVAKFIGKDGLGLYSMARTLTSIPAERLTGVVMAVSSGLFASVQKDDVETRRYFLGLVEMLSFVLLPIVIGLSLVSREAVPIVLGSQWVDAIPIVQVLAVVVAFRSLGPVCSQVLLARLRARANLRYTVFSAIVFPIGFLMGVRFGVMGVAYAWLLLSLPLTWIPLNMVCNEIQLSRRQLARTLLGPVSCTLVMAGVVSLVRTTEIISSASDLQRLVALSGLGALAYIVSSLMIMRSRLEAMIAFFRSRNSPELASHERT